jgi:hypothetical protein
MRVTIEHVETKEIITPSLFASKKPVYRVNVGIVFSEEELAIIKHRNLSKTGVNLPPNKIFSSLANGDEKRVARVSFVDIERIHKNGGVSEAFQTIPEAQDFEKHVRDKFLPTLKSLIFDTADYGKPSEPFEV